MQRDHKGQPMTYWGGNPDGQSAPCSSPCSPPLFVTLEDVIQSRLQWLKEYQGPVVAWVPVGDYLSVFWEDAAYHAVPVSNDLTLYMAIDDNRVVGCKVHCLTQVMCKSAR
jgi:hypothetical protein